MDSKAMRKLLLTTVILIGGCVNPQQPVALGSPRIPSPAVTQQKIIPQYYTGLVLQNLTEELVQVEPRFADGGALVFSVDPNSPAERAGLMRGDIITAINNVQVRSALEFAAVFQSKEIEPAALRVYRLESTFMPRNIVFVRNGMPEAQNDKREPK